MSFDDRIIIKQKFEHDGKNCVNSLKLIENDNFVQLYINSGEHANRGQMRLYASQLQQLKEFLEKVEIKG